MEAVLWATVRRCGSGQGALQSSHLAVRVQAATCKVQLSQADPLRFLPHPYSAAAQTTSPTQDIFMVGGHTTAERYFRHYNHNSRTVKSYLMSSNRWYPGVASCSEAVHESCEEWWRHDVEGIQVSESCAGRQG